MNGYKVCKVSWPSAKIVDLAQPCELMAFQQRLGSVLQSNLGAFLALLLHSYSTVLSIVTVK